MTSLNNKKVFPRHYFNHIEYTSWPFFISIWTGVLIFFFLLYINKYSSVTPVILLLSYIFLFFQIENWNSDIIIESTFLGRYNKKIYSSIVIGFYLFLVSEIMLFGGFFWAFFDRIFFISAYSENISRLSPPGNPWFLVDTIRLPLFSSLLLVSSGYLCNLGFYSLRIGLKDNAYVCMGSCIIVGFLFLIVQEFEYLEFNITMAHGVYISLFFLLTGFHGMHVLVGILMLCTQTDRIWNNHFSIQRMSGLGFAVIYWHFVDIIWLLLYTFVYLFNNINSIQLVEYQGTNLYDGIGNINSFRIFNHYFRA